MRFSKEIIQQFVSYIDLDDVKSFTLLHPELVEVENTKENEKIFTEFFINTVDISSLKIRKIYKSNKYDYIICNSYIY